MVWASSASEQDQHETVQRGAARSRQVYLGSPPTSLQHDYRSAGCSSPLLPRCVKRLTSHTRTVVSMLPEAKLLSSGVRGQDNRGEIRRS